MPVRHGFGSDWDFQEHLRADGIPAPEIITTHAGDGGVTNGRRMGVLFRCVAGRPYDGASARHCMVRARCLDLRAATEDIAGTAVVMRPSRTRTAGGARWRTSSGEASVDPAEPAG